VVKLSSVDVDGIELTYRIAGEAGLPVMVLLHGLGDESSTWNAVVEALAPAHAGVRAGLAATGPARSRVPTLWS